MSRRLVIAESIIDSNGRLGDAILIDGDSIAAVGRVEDLRSEGLEEKAYPDGVIVPGLRDAHLHPIGHAASLARPSLKAAGSFADIADAVTEAMAAQPPGTAVTAMRLDDEGLAEGRLPDRTFLDTFSGDVPVLLIRYCGHVAVANTAALEAAGIDESTPDPRGGSLDREDSGRPTGVLRETAVTPVIEVLRHRAPAITAADIAAAATGLAAVGLTGIGAMVSPDSGLWAGGSSELEALISAAPSIPVTMRVMVIASSPAELEEAAARIGETGGNIEFHGLKMFSDGSFGGHTAAMEEGFADRPGETGTDRLDPDWCLAMARASLRIGGCVAIHAIGDRANRNVLDVMEKILSEGADPTLLRIEHASVLSATDIARFGSLGITASVQPAFIASETEWLEKRLGPERLRRTYPFRSLAGAGAMLAGGSDCPVEPPHPLWGMAAARDRCGIVPEEALKGPEALALFTDGSSKAIGESATLTKGAPASLTVLDGDPVRASPDRLRSMRVLGTIVEGRSIEVPEGTAVWAG